MSSAVHMLAADENRAPPHDAVRGLLVKTPLDVSLGGLIYSLAYRF